MNGPQGSAAGAGPAVGMKETQRVVIGGLDNVVAGDVITRYMDKQARDLKGIADALRIGDGIIVTLPEKALFRSRGADLGPQSSDLLDKIAAVVNKYPETRLTVVGHTDNRGFADFDIHLSERRAAAVADVLIKSSVAERRIRIMGMGFERPVANNDTVEGRARNRRVEIHIAPDDELRKKDRAQSS
jgi:outer membrane protein OmpA-like peptidoglycan-associated protein